MNSYRQGWLVATREMRERARSRAFQASVVIMIVVVVGVIVLPSLLEGGAGTRDIGLVRPIPAELEASLRAEGRAMGTTVRLRRYPTVAVGEAAVREGHVDVLVVGGRRLEWRRRADEQLRALVIGAIQLGAVQERATTAGIDPGVALGLLAPVAVDDVELGSAPGRTADDETAATLMTIALFITISTYGSLVLTGVVEEKSNRVVEVLLARMSARTLLAGKVAGIGLLGLVQMAATAVAALVAVASVDSIDVPSVRGSVLAWLVVWFVLGYALYAMAEGALGSLASRPEDAQSAVGPLMAVMLAGYFASFAAVGSPDTGWARFVSFFPLTAPLAMPARIALGAAAWWEPPVAVALTLAAIVALVRFGGRVYAGAVLHLGPAIRLRDAWRGAPTARTRPVT